MGVMIIEFKNSGRYTFAGTLRLRTRLQSTGHTNHRPRLQLRSTQFTKALGPVPVKSLGNWIV